MNNKLNDKKDFMTYYKYKLPIVFNPLDYENVIRISNSDYVVPLMNSRFI